MEQIVNFFLIKDLSRLSGHSVHTLKFYLKVGLIHEVGRSPETRFRYFDQTTVEQLSRIRSLRKERKSLVEISRLLEDSDSSGFRVVGSGQLPRTPNPEPRTAS